MHKLKKVTFHIVDPTMSKKVQSEYYFWSYVKCLQTHLYNDIEQCSPLSVYISIEGKVFLLQQFSHSIDFLKSRLVSPGILFLPANAQFNKCHKYDAKTEYMSPSVDIITNEWYSRTNRLCEVRTGGKLVQDLNNSAIKWKTNSCNCQKKKKSSKCK